MLHTRAAPLVLRRPGRARLGAWLLVLASAASPAAASVLEDSFACGYLGGVGSGPRSCPSRFVPGVSGTDRSSFRRVRIAEPWSGRDPSRYDRIPEFRACPIEGEEEDPCAAADEERRRASDAVYACWASRRTCHVVLDTCVGRLDVFVEPGEHGGFVVVPLSTWEPVAPFTSIRINRWGEYVWRMEGDAYEEDDPVRAF